MPWRLTDEPELNTGTVSITTTDGPDWWVRRTADGELEYSTDQVEWRRLAPPAASPEIPEP